MRAALARSAVATAVAGLGVTGIGFVGAGTAMAATTCTPNVANTGLSAAVVAHSHQRIANQAIDASGCDIGIYVGAGANHVTIASVKVSGANFQGIFAEKTSYLTVSHSTVTDNGFNTIDPSAPPLPGSGLHSRVGQAFAISLFGVSHSTVAGNSVYNNGRGGIGLMDNGPNDPGALTQNPNARVVASSHDKIVHNRTWQNYGGCGIVAATQNFAGRLSHLLIAGNTVSGTGMSANGPDVGGIVVAADLPNSTVSNVRVSRNTVTDSFEGGVIVNAEAPNSSTRRVHVFSNTVSGNNWGAQEAPKTAGIIVFANPQAAPPKMHAAANIGTVVAHHTATNQFYGIWSQGNYPPKILRNLIQVTAGGTPIFPAPKSHHRHAGHHGGHSHH
jgi:hypothetical protein